MGSAVCQYLEQLCAVGRAIPQRGATVEVELLLVKQDMVSVVHMALAMEVVDTTGGMMTGDIRHVKHIAAEVQHQLEKGPIPGLALNETMGALQREQEVHMIALLAAWPLDSSTAEALLAAQHPSAIANARLCVTRLEAKMPFITAGAQTCRHVQPATVQSASLQ